MADCLEWLFLARVNYAFCTSFCMGYPGIWQGIPTLRKRLAVRDAKGDTTQTPKRKGENGALNSIRKEREGSERAYRRGSEIA